MRKASPKTKTRSRTARFFPSSARSRSVCGLCAPPVASITGIFASRRPTARCGGGSGGGRGGRPGFRGGAAGQEMLFFKKIIFGRRLRYG
jgi:hypothetical protein